MLNVQSDVQFQVSTPDSRGANDYIVIFAEGKSLAELRSKIDGALKMMR